MEDLEKLLNHNNGMVEEADLNDIDTLLENLEAHKQSKTPYYSCEYRIKTKDGNYKWIFARGKVGVGIKECKMAGDFKMEE